MKHNSPAHILIIDNDEDLAVAIQTRLTSLGYQCVTAATGKDGLDILDQGSFHLVITDLNMPGGDGIHVLESIRRRGTVPVIVVTGFASEYRDQLRGLSNVTCLTKPFETESLIDLVEMELASCSSEAQT